MARRRMSGYGSAPLPKPQANEFPLPPAPDGKPPVRLPVGVSQAPAASPTPTGDEDLLRLLQMLGGQPDQM